MTPKILASYEKANAENVKDLLNRRQAHLKNTIGDDDAFATTAKGLYDKAKKQGEGPLYDTSETAKYIERNTPDESSIPAPDRNSESAASVLEDTPDYQSIVQKAEVKADAKETKAPASTVQ